MGTFCGSNLLLQRIQIAHTFYMIPFAGIQSQNSSAYARARSSVRFISKNWWKVLAISGVVLIPCFWHKYIEACDLPSHTYNAWLASLISDGHAPGLYIAHQSNNILFDVLLTHLGPILGFGPAEKTLVSCAVLIFFWGLFALMTTASQNVPWTLVPAIAMITYGWTLEIGFINYYLSLAIAFWALSLLWDARKWEWLLLIPLAGLAWMAHPIGSLFLLAALIYVHAFRAVQSFWKIFPFAGALLLMGALHFYLRTNYEVKWMKFKSLVNGVDQIVLGGHYRQLGQATLLFGVVIVAVDIWQRRRESGLWKAISFPLSLYALTFAMIYLLPDEIALPSYAVTFSMIALRLTTLAAASALCVLSLARPKAWHCVAFGAAAVLFFALLWKDTDRIAALESQAQRIVAQLPAGTRVIANFEPFPDSRFYYLTHVVDRACIGRCFSFTNYEPSSLQFRLRVSPGSPVVAASPADITAILDGEYIVKPQDLPFARIGQCMPDLDSLCVREYRPGDRTGLFLSPRRD